MNKIILLVALVSFSCKSTDKRDQPTFVFLSMEKTECMGKCPAYKVEFYNDGRMVYAGNKNVPSVGQASFQLKKSDLSNVIAWTEEINFFKLQDRYMAEATDLPTIILIYNDGEKEKTVIDYYNAPEKLKEFEEKLEKVVFSYLN